MAMESATIHGCRQVGWQRSSTRNDQGEYEQVQVVGPWIDARVMLAGRGGVNETRGQGPSTEAEVVYTYELLIQANDRNGNPVDPPTASSVFETDCPVLGNPTIKLTGEPEWLNNGTDLIGWDAHGAVPLDRS